MVTEELGKARDRGSRVRGASTSSQVYRLMGLQTRLRVLIRQQGP